MNTYIQGPLIDAWPSYRAGKEQENIQFAISYIRGESDNASPLNNFLASDPTHSRLLLYLPLEILAKTPQALDKSVVRQAFGELFCHHDVRENFNEGDISDVPADQRVRVIKIFHLIPWLLRGQYIDGLDLIALAELAVKRRDKLIFSGLSDVLPFLNGSKILERTISQKLNRIVAEGNREISEPSSRAQPMTAERQKWLAERERYHGGKHAISLKNTTNPFSKNFGFNEYNYVAKLLDELPEGAIIRVYGSRIKGYGRSDSDLDYEVISRAEMEQKVPDPEKSNLVFNTFYASQAVSLDALHEIQCKLAEPYFRLAPGDSRRRDALANMEKDLLQYRLLHKGFPYACRDLSPETRDYPTMDGASAFYDDRYRKVASELYLKYVYLPQL